MASFGTTTVSLLIDAKISGTLTFETPWYSAVALFVIMAITWAWFYKVIRDV
jgi:hypothetical protein